MTSGDVWTAGHLTVDDVVFWDGSVHFGSAGGAALYAGIGAALLGARTHVATRLGDGYPHAELNRFAQVGVHLVPSVGSEESISQWVLYERDGSRTYVLHPNSGSHDRMSPSPSDYVIPDSVAVHVAPMPAARQLEWCLARRGRRSVLTLDPHADGCRDFPAEVLAMAAMVDAFLPSEVESAALAGPDPVAAVCTFLRAGAPIAVVKLGDDGSLVGTPEAIWHVPVVPVPVVDVTGAGDSYCGGFVAALSGGLDALRAACAATAIASVIVEVHGNAIASFPEARLEVARRLESIIPTLVTRLGDDTHSSRNQQFKRSKP